MVGSEVDVLVRVGRFAVYCSCKLVVCLLDKEIKEGDLTDGLFQTP